MHLVSLEVKGLKSLRETKVEGLDHYNVFIGKNDSGKSTLLECIGLVTNILSPLDAKHVAEVITDRPQSGSLRVSITVRISEDDVADMGMEADELAQRALERMRIWRFGLELPVHMGLEETQFYVNHAGFVSGNEYTELLARDAAEAKWRVLNPRGLQAVLSNLDAGRDRTLSGLADGSWISVVQAPYVTHDSLWPTEAFYLGALRRLGASVTQLQTARDAADEMPLGATRRLESSGGNLVQVVETLKSTYPDEFHQIETLIASLFPEVVGIHTPTEGASKVIRLSTGAALQPLQSFRLSEVGMGVRQALIVATAVASPEGSSVILVEEPENNLHPGAQRVLAQWLKKYAVENHKQILVTTHSTIFASTEDDCSTYLVRLDDDQGTKATKLDTGHQPLVKEELGIRNVDLYGFNGVVLWEGDSEYQAMPLLLEAIAEQVGKSVHAAGLTSRNLYGHTNAKLQAVRQFLGLLDTLDIASYVIMDDDEGVREELEKLVQDDLLPEGHYHVWDQGRKMHGRNPDVGCEFEDNFSNDQLMEAATSVAQDAGITIEFNVDEFARRCTEPTGKTSDVLRKYYYQVTDYGLSKPDLARKLAELVTPELRGKAERTVKEYEFEKVALDIFRRLGGLNV